jgi:hypothetical protein
MQEEEPVLLHAPSNVMTDVSLEAIISNPKPCPAIVTKKSQDTGNSVVQYGYDNIRYVPNS